MAALGTLVLLLLLVLAPLVSVLGVAANEALRLTDSVGPRLAKIVSEPTAIDAQLQRLPGYPTSGRTGNSSSRRSEN